MMMHNARYDVTYGKTLTILTPKQMLQRLSIAFAKVKSGNTSENPTNHIFFVSSKGSC